MKKLNKTFALPIAMGALVGLAGAQQAQAADTVATLTVGNFTTVSATAGVTITPTLEEIQTDSKASVGGVTLTVTTNGETGCKVTVKAAAGDSRSTKITPGDIQIKSATSGTTAPFSAYTALTTSDVDLWNVTTPVPDGTPVTLDVKFLNLKLYPSAAGGVSKDYTNTLTFTAVANS